ncbi:MAG TPA: hypothetical protein VGN60_02805 [Devosia sp.]|jgi:hypothetical protein|nr:hypothetical protein [Devosia sp.]
MTETDEFNNPLPVGAIPLRKVGPSAYVRFGVDELEKLEGWIYDFAGKDSAPWEVALARLEVMDRRFMAVLLDTGLTNAKPADAFAAMPLSELAEHLSDAICQILYGRNFREQIEHNQAKAHAYALKMRSVVEGKEDA